jgi:hypothetical protein
MIIGTYVDGRPLGYDEASNSFDVGGTAVGIQDVIAYDQAAHLTWASEDLKSWAYQVSASMAPAAPAAPQYAQAAPVGAIQSHAVPKCLSCGYVGPWKVDGLLRPMDWVIGLLFMVAFGSGLVYLVVVALLRSNKNNRAKICTNCKARNMFAFQY